LDLIKSLGTNSNLKYLSISERNGVSKFDLLKTDFLIVKYILPKLNDLKPIECFNQLTHLEIKDSKFLRKADTLEKLNHLQFLFFSNCSELEDINSLTNSTSLKQLEISTFCNKISNIELLFNSKQLEIISLIECLGINSIEIKRINKSIKKLILVGCNNLKQIKNLNNLKVLNKLQIEHCKNFEMISISTLPFFDNVE
jgi:hypothetical protein